MSHLLKPTTSLYKYQVLMGKLFAREFQVFRVNKDTIL